MILIFKNSMLDISNKINLDQLLDLAKECNYGTKYYLLYFLENHIMYYLIKQN